MGMMISQTKILARTEWYNIFGLNVLRFSKDKRIKRRAVLLAVTYILVVFMIMFYVGAQSYGLCLLSLCDIVPAYLIMISTLLIFFFGIFMLCDIGKSVSSCCMARNCDGADEFWEAYPVPASVSRGAVSCRGPYFRLFP